MKKKQKDFFQIVSLGKIAGLVLGMGLFLFCFNVIPVKADAPELIKHGPVFQGTLAKSDYARIIKAGSTYHMWYEDTTAETLYHTTSTDGENWETEELCTNVSTSVHEPDVIYDEDIGIFKMWYESESGGKDAIWYAVSNDGIDWGNSSQPVTFSDGANDWEDNGRYMPFVMKDESSYKMWYQSFSTLDTGDKRINYATSSNGVDWDNSGNYGQVTFSENTNNNIVLAIGGTDEWDEGGIYSQAITDITAQLEDGSPINIYLMLYGGLSAIPGDFHKIGGAGSEDGVNWFKSEYGHILSSEGDGDIWFPSMVLSMDNNNLDNAYLQIWYMKEDTVQYATLGGILQNYLEDTSNKAHIDSWKAYRYTTDSACPNKLKVIIKGKHFENDAEVRIGGKKASSVNVKNSKKLTAKFCLSKLLDVQTDHKRVISVTNPDTDREEARKKINLDDISYQITTGTLDIQSVEGIKNIQKALNQLGLLDQQYITGIYGPITTEAVREFQQQNGLPTTGYFGPLTQAKMQEKMK